MLGAVALLVVGSVLVMGVSMADGTENSVGNTWRAEAVQAVEDNNFDAWKAAMLGGLTVERFNGIVQRFQGRSEMKAQMQERETAVREALEQEDYEAWKAAVDSFGKGRNVSEMVSEEEFATIVEIYKAREAGDYTTARTLMEESGLGLLPGIGSVMGMSREMGAKGQGIGMGGKGEREMKRDRDCTGLGRDFE